MEDIKELVKYIRSFIKRALKNLKRKNKLILIVEVMDGKEVPKVIYNGKNYKHIRSIDFNWANIGHTEEPSGSYFNIDYFDEKDIDEGLLKSTRIGFVSGEKING